jgi:hypothetical protein
LLTKLGRLPGVFTTRESQLPGDEYTGLSITNSNKSLNLRKNLKSFLGVSNGTRRRFLMKKPESKNLVTPVVTMQIRSAIILLYIYMYIYIYIYIYILYMCVFLETIKYIDFRNLFCSTLNLLLLRRGARAAIG